MFIDVLNVLLNGKWTRLMSNVVENIVSFDVSSVSTGWAFFRNGKLDSIGTIQPPSECRLQEKLYWFRNEVISILNIFKPDYAVVEETYLKNVKTLKTLMQFIGVINVACFTEIAKDPIFVSPQTVRSHFGIKSKEDAFDYVKTKYKIKLKDFTFETGNDISDAVIQGLYWLDVLIERGKTDE